LPELPEEKVALDGEMALEQIVELFVRTRGVKDGNTNGDAGDCECQQDPDTNQHVFGLLSDSAELSIAA